MSDNGRVVLYGDTHTSQDSIKTAADMVRGGGFDTILSEGLESEEDQVPHLYDRYRFDSLAGLAQTFDEAFNYRFLDQDFDQYGKRTLERVNRSTLERFENLKPAHPELQEIREEIIEIAEEHGEPDEEYRDLFGKAEYDDPETLIDLVNTPFWKMDLSEREIEPMIDFLEYQARRWEETDLADPLDWIEKTIANLKEMPGKNSDKQRHDDVLYDAWIDEWIANGGGSPIIEGVDHPDRENVPREEREAYMANRIIGSEGDVFAFVGSNHVESGSELRDILDRADINYEVVDEEHEASYLEAIDYSSQVS